MSKGHPDHEKTFAVGEWLKERFPGLSVLDVFDPQRLSQLYQIRQGTTLRHRVLISEDFFADHTIEEIVALLREWGTDQTIRHAEERLVVIDNHGVRVPAREG